MPAQAPSGRIGLTDEQGQSQAGNFEGQARVTFRAIDRFAEEAVGSAQSSLCVNDARGPLLSRISKPSRPGASQHLQHGSPAVSPLRGGALRFVPGSVFRVDLRQAPSGQNSSRRVAFPTVTLEPVKLLPRFSEAVRILDNPGPQRDHADEQLHACIREFVFDSGRHLFEVMPQH